jgi:hypothetical protein
MQCKPFVKLFVVRVKEKNGQYINREIAKTKQYKPFVKLFVVRVKEKNGQYTNREIGYTENVTKPTQT